MRFALFFLGEYMHMIAGAAFFTLLFLGGWDVPIYQEPAVGGFALVLLKAAVFAFKVFLVVTSMMVLRWTLPRFRFDQLMRLAWRSLIPMTLLILLASAFVVFAHAGRSHGWWFLVVNVATVVVVIAVAPFIPQGPPVNRRVPLEGSRFSPAN